MTHWIKGSERLIALIVVVLVFILIGFQLMIHIPAMADYLSPVNTLEGIPVQKR